MLPPFRRPTWPARAQSPARAAESGWPPRQVRGRSWAVSLPLVAGRLPRRPSQRVWTPARACARAIPVLPRPVVASGQGWLRWLCPWRWYMVFHWLCQWAAWVCAEANATCEWRCAGAVSWPRAGPRRDVEFRPASGNSCAANSWRYLMKAASNAASAASLSGIRDSKRPSLTKKVLKHPPPGLHCRQDKSSQDLRVAKITRLDTRLRHKHIQCVSACVRMWPTMHKFGGPCQRVTYPPLESGPSCYYHSSNSLICWPVTDNKYSTCTTTR